MNQADREQAHEAQAERARAFAALHVKGEPLVLYNVWDAGSAKAVAAAGAAAIATGSWSVAAAQGYPDGEQIPLQLLATIARRIVETVEVPVSIDVEGAYGRRPQEVARTAGLLLDAGAVGINFEDQVVGGEGLYEIAEQAERIAAIRRTAERNGVELFINARTDLFLKQRDRARHAELLGEALERAAAYAAAGASGFFAPGLLDEAPIAELCRATALPVNILAFEEAPPLERLAALGVARVSHGPLPYRALMRHLQDQAAAQLRR